MRNTLLALALVLSPALAAQQASYTYIDQPPQYGNPSPLWLHALNAPKSGQLFRVQVPGSWISGRFCWVTYYFLTGVSNPSLDLGPMTNWMVPSYLFSSAESIIPIPNIGWVPRTYTFSFRIPSSPALLGTSFYQQVLNRRSGSCRNSVRLGRGGHGIIGT